MCGITGAWMLFPVMDKELESNVYFVSEIPKWALYDELIQGNPVACAPLEAS